MENPICSNCGQPIELSTDIEHYEDTGMVCDRCLADKLGIEICGQSVTITAGGGFPVRLDFQGVHMISTLDATAVEMSLQDARELQAKLRKALARYDRQQHDKQARADWVQLFGNGKPSSI